LRSSSSGGRGAGETFQGQAEEGGEVRIGDVVVLSDGVDRVEDCPFPRVRMTVIGLRGGTIDVAWLEDGDIREASFWEGDLEVEQ
jgi:hypothetical protein